MVSEEAGIAAWETIPSDPVLILPIRTGQVQSPIP